MATTSKTSCFRVPGVQRWNGIVALIYDRATMQRRFEAAFAKRLALRSGDA